MNTYEIWFDGKIHVIIAKDFTMHDNGVALFWNANDDLIGVAPSGSLVLIKQ